MEIMFRLVLMALIGGVAAYRLAMWRMAARPSNKEAPPASDRGPIQPAKVLPGILR